MFENTVNYVLIFLAHDNGGFQGKKKKNSSPPESQKSYIYNTYIYIYIRLLSAFGFCTYPAPALRSMSKGARSGCRRSQCDIKYDGVTKDFEQNLHLFGPKF